MATCSSTAPHRATPRPRGRSETADEFPVCEKSALGVLLLMVVGQVSRRALARSGCEAWHLEVM